MCVGVHIWLGEDVCVWVCAEWQNRVIFDKSIRNEFYKCTDWHVWVCLCSVLELEAPKRFYFWKKSQISFVTHISLSLVHFVFCSVIPVDATDFRWRKIGKIVHSNCNEWRRLAPICRNSVDSVKINMWHTILCIVVRPQSDAQSLLCVCSEMQPTDQPTTIYNVIWSDFITQFHRRISQLIRMQMTQRQREQQFQTFCRRVDRRDARERERDAWREKERENETI